MLFSQEYLIWSGVLIYEVNEKFVVNNSYIFDYMVTLKFADKFVSKDKLGRRLSISVQIASFYHEEFLNYPIFKCLPYSATLRPKIK